jgi:hypothetical protein
MGKQPMSQSVDTLAVADIVMFEIVASGQQLGCVDIVSLQAPKRRFDHTVDTPLYATIGTGANGFAYISLAFLELGFADDVGKQVAIIYLAFFDEALEHTHDVFGRSGGDFCVDVWLQALDCFWSRRELKALLDG